MKKRGFFFQIGLWLNRLRYPLRFVSTVAVFVINELYMHELMIRLGCLAGLGILIFMIVREHKYPAPATDEEWYEYMRRLRGAWGAAWIIAVFGIYAILSLVNTFMRKGPIPGDNIMEWVWRIYFCLSLMSRWCYRFLAIDLRK